MKIKRFKKQRRPRRGLTEKELLDHPFAEYVYQRLDGAPVYRVVRFQKGDQKTFRPEIPDGSGGWIRRGGSLEGVPRVPYRYTDLKGHLRIHFVEGEGCADCGWQHGMPTTTTIGGCKGWKDDHRIAEQVRALGVKEVIVFPDNDEGGRAYANAVSRAMFDAGLRVKIVDLGLAERGADIVDFFEGGSSRRDLARLVKATPWFDIPAEERDYLSLEGIEPEEVEFLWRPYIPKAKLTFLDGNPGDGKSYATADLAARGSRGDVFPLSAMPDFLRRPPFRTLMMSIEDGVADTIVPRMQRLRGNMKNIFVWQKPVAFDDPGLRRIEKTIVREGIELVVVDPIVSYLGARVDMFRANETRPVLDALASVARRTNCAILCIRHLTKGERDNALYRGQGSIDFSAAARSVLMLGRNPKDDSERVLVHIKSSLAEPGPSMAFTIGDEGLKWLGVSHLKAEDLFHKGSGAKHLARAAEFLRAALKDGPVVSRRLFRLGERSGFPQRTLERVKELGLIPLVARATREKGRRGVKVWSWALAEVELGGVNTVGSDSSRKIGPKPASLTPPTEPPTVGGLDAVGKSAKTRPRSRKRRSTPPTSRAGGRAKKARRR